MSDDNPPSGGRWRRPIENLPELLSEVARLLSTSGLNVVKLERGEVVDYLAEDIVRRAAHLLQSRKPSPTVETFDDALSTNGEWKMDLHEERAARAHRIEEHYGLWFHIANGQITEHAGWKSEDRKATEHELLLWREIEKSYYRDGGT